MCVPAPAFQAEWQVAGPVSAVPICITGQISRICICIIITTSQVSIASAFSTWAESIDTTITDHLLGSLNSGSETACATGVYTSYLRPESIIAKEELFTPRPSNCGTTTFSFVWRRVWPASAERRPSSRAQARATGSAGRASPASGQASPWAPCPGGGGCSSPARRRSPPSTSPPVPVRRRAGPQH